jgi:hypothetical protein
VTSLLQQREPPRREQQEPGDRAGEVEVVADLGERDVAELRLGRWNASASSSAPAPRWAARRQQHAGLAEQVERGVGQRDLLLQLRRVGDPLGEALRADQRVVAEHEAVLREVRRVDAVRDGRGDLLLHVLEAGAERPLAVLVGLGQRVVDVLAHRWGTSSGMT